MKIIFTGGGTLGSVMPLLTLALACEKNGVSKKNELFWIGTQTGPERVLVEKGEIVFFGIYAGKLRRYFDLRNFLDPFLCIIGCMQALILMIRIRPSLIVHAGSFVGVPVCWMGWLLGIRVAVLQMDIVPSLANILVRHCAWTFFVSCEKAAAFFPEKKVVLSGIPLREKIGEAHTQVKNAATLKQARDFFHIPVSTPLVVILGGGTGSQDLNTLVWDSLEYLTPHVYIIHCTGKDKTPPFEIKNTCYQWHEFFEEHVELLLACADIVVTRAGMGVLSELSALGKPALIIPLPNSQQERNASFVEEHGAGKYCTQKALTPKKFAKEILDLLADPMRKMTYSQNIKKLFPENATETIIKVIKSLKTG